MAVPRKRDAARDLAERVREACVAAALRGYEDAAMSGLCAEGALEAAISAIRMVDVGALAAGTPPPPPREET